MESYLKVLSFCLLQKLDFFNRLSAPPWRLELTQMVLYMTTQTQPGTPGAIRGCLGATPRPYAGYRVAPAVARGRGLNLDSGILLAISNIFFENRALENSKNGFYAEFNSE